MNLYRIKEDDILRPHRSIENACKITAEGLKVLLENSDGAIINIFANRNYSTFVFVLQIRFHT